ncbi:glycosyltransferase [Desulfobacterales bacterium HSG16]|nr:glycosyltransferase [Desulfobacterales bacterium HSG16]
MGQDLVLAANRPPKKGGFHPEDREFVKKTFYLNPIRIKPYLVSNLKFFFRSPFRYIRTLILALRLKDGFFMKQRIRNLARVAGACVLADYLLKQKVCHVHVHFAFGAAGVAIFLKSLADISYSISVHGSDVLLPQPLTREKLMHADFIRSNCRFHIKNLILRYPCLKKKRFYHVRLAMDFMAEHWMRTTRPVVDSRLRILNVARLEPVKAHYLLICACALLKKKNIPFILKIAGDGPLMADLESMVKNEGLDDCVHLLGTRYENEVADLFDWSHVFALSSLSEGTPMSIIEAMTKARAVIAPDITALPEMVIHGKTGFLFEKESAESLADFLEKMAMNPEKTGQMGYEAKKTAFKYYDPMFNTKKLLSVFLKEIQDNGEY